TIHSEYGLRFKVDVLNTYFSPRLAYEHRRVAEEVRDGEIVVDMFTGVGPFAIHIASLRRCLVYAVDLNPAAYRLLIENIKLNKRNLKGEIIPVNADVRLLAKYIRNIANRVIMNLPEYSHEFVGTALTLLRKEGGVIHYYTFEDEPEELEKAVRKLRCLVEAQGRRILKVLKVRRVKSIAPHRWHIVVDALVS
ncbi:MAG: class I SAM-dependent methyltransferase family protein, partial [Thermoprotei archaeon]